MADLRRVYHADKVGARERRLVIECTLLRQLNPFSPEVHNVEAGRLALDPLIGLERVEPAGQEAPQVHSHGAEHDDGVGGRVGDLVDEWQEGQLKLANKTAILVQGQTIFKHQTDIQRYYVYCNICLLIGSVTSTGAFLSYT